MTCAIKEQIIEEHRACIRDMTFKNNEQEYSELEQKIWLDYHEKQVEVLAGEIDLQVKPKFYVVCITETNQVDIWSGKTRDALIDYLHSPKFKTTQGYLFHSFNNLIDLYDTYGNMNFTIDDNWEVSDHDAKMFSMSFNSRDRTEVVTCYGSEEDCLKAEVSYWLGLICKESNMPELSIFYNKDEGRRWISKVLPHKKYGPKELKILLDYDDKWDE